MLARRSSVDPWREPRADGRVKTRFHTSRTRTLMGGMGRREEWVRSVGRKGLPYDCTAAADGSDYIEQYGQRHKSVQAARHGTRDPAFAPSTPPRFT